VTTGAYTGHTDSQILNLLLDEAYTDSFDDDPTPPEPPVDYHDWPDDAPDDGALDDGDPDAPARRPDPVGPLLRVRRWVVGGVGFACGSGWAP
jgi:hypothetical protein